jgi:LmbE family N-acetylglucosaminyl deacetylase
MTTNAIPYERSQLEIIDAVPKRALVVFAHPDDGELGAGGVIATWSAQGCEIAMVVCTSGSSGSNDTAMTSESIVAIRRSEQLKASEVAGAQHVEFLDHPDGELEADRAFLGEIVWMIRKYRPEVVLCHDPHRFNGFNHRDHRMVGTGVLDAIYPYARDHLHFPEQMEHEGIEPHKVREVLMWGSDSPNAIVDTSRGVEKQIEALHQHKSQVEGLSGGPAVGDRLRERARVVATNYPFEYGQAYRRLIARA